MAPLSITEEGRKWYSEDAIANLAGKKMTVNRASAPGQYTLSLLENATARRCAPTISAARACCSASVPKTPKAMTRAEDFSPPS